MTFRRASSRRKRRLKRRIWKALNGDKKQEGRPMSGLRTIIPVESFEAKATPDDTQRGRNFLNLNVDHLALPLFSRNKWLSRRSEKRVGWVMVDDGRRRRRRVFGLVTIWTEMSKKGWREGESQTNGRDHCAQEWRRHFQQCLITAELPLRYMFLWSAWDSGEHKTCIFNVYITLFRFFQCGDCFVAALTKVRPDPSSS